MDAADRKKLKELQELDKIITTNKKNAANGKIVEPKPNPIDIHIGKRLKKMRQFVGYTQKQVGDILGVSAGQIQKYEQGTLRLYGSRLYDLAAVFHVSVNFFFYDMPNIAAYQSPASIRDPFFQLVYAQQEKDAYLTSMELKLLTHFRKLTPLQKYIILLIKEVVDVENEADDEQDDALDDTFENTSDDATNNTLDKE